MKGEGLQVRTPGLGLLLPDSDMGAPELLSLAHEAEMAGFSSLWAGEVKAADAFAVLGALSTSTSTASFGTAVVNCFSRSPLQVALGAATVQRLTGRPFWLGLGTSTRRLIELCHDSEFRAPLSRLEDYVERVRDVLGGQPRAYSGRVMHGGGFRIATASPSQISVFAAALGPRAMARLAPLVDGLVLNWFSQDGVSRARTLSIEASGDQAPGCLLGTILHVRCGSEAGSLVAAREQLAFYARVPAYAGSFAWQGWSDGGEIPDGVLRELAPHGASQASRTIDGYFEAGVDFIIVSPVPAGRGTESATEIETLVRDFGGLSTRRRAERSGV